MNVNVVIMIDCQHNWIFLRQKKIISIHHLTGQNLGLSGLKNILPVIMTGNLLSVICSPDIGTTATLNLLIFVGHNNFRRSFQSRGRDRPNRFGGGNRNASNSTAVNGPAVNGRFPV